MLTLPCPVPRNTWAAVYLFTRRKWGNSFGAAVRSLDNYLYRPAEPLQTDQWVESEPLSARKHGCRKRVHKRHRSRRSIHPPRTHRWLGKLQREDLCRSTSAYVIITDRKITQSISGSRQVSRRQML